MARIIHDAHHVSKSLLHIRYVELDRPFYRAQIDEQKSLVFKKSVWLKAEDITLTKENFLQAQRARVWAAMIV